MITYPEAITVGFAARHDVAHEEAGRVLASTSEREAEPGGASSPELDVPGDADDRHLGTAAATPGTVAVGGRHARRRRRRAARGARARAAR